MLVSVPLFVQAINFVLFMAFVMLTIEQNIQQFSPVTVFCFIAFATQTLTNFVTYRTAEAFTTCSLRFTDIIHDSSWYVLPVNQQKKLVFVIQRAEKLFILKGSAIFHVNMEMFANVTLIKWGIDENILIIRVFLFLVFSSIMHVLFDVKTIEAERMKNAIGNKEMD